MASSLVPVISIDSSLTATVWLRAHPGYQAEAATRDSRTKQTPIAEEPAAQTIKRPFPTRALIESRPPQTLPTPSNEQL
jgi:hypothetical protein